MRVERRVVHETVREPAAGSRSHADHVVASAERAGAPIAPPAARSAERPPAPDPTPAPVQSLDELLRRFPGQAAAQPVVAPVARPSVTIRRLVVEVTPPAQPAPPSPRRPRRRRGAEARSDTRAGSPSRLRFGLGQR